MTGSSTKPYGLYSLVDGNESDATITESVDSLEKSLRLSRHSDPWPTAASAREERELRSVRLVWLRWGAIVILQTMIIVLLTLQSRAQKSGLDASSDVETGGDINGLYPTLGHDYRRLKFEDDIYMPNMTTNDDRLEIRKRWDKLMPMGSGSVSIPDYREHPLLGPPIADDPLRSGPLYEASWTHALHCLYYSVDSYHQLIVNGRTGEENPHHAKHCFEYLRTNILCNLDMTLEGSYSANRDSGGQAHVCRNRDQAIKWIEDRRVDDMQDIVGP